MSFSDKAALTRQQENKQKHNILCSLIRYTNGGFLVSFLSSCTQSNDHYFRPVLLFESSISFSFSYIFATSFNVFAFSMDGILLGCCVLRIVFSAALLPLRSSLLVSLCWNSWTKSGPRKEETLSTTAHWKCLHFFGFFPTELISKGKSMLNLKPPKAATTISIWRWRQETWTLRY